MGKSALAITEEHHELADAATGALSRAKSRAAARATLDGSSSHPPEIWAASTELGWNGLAIEERFGGSGFGVEELVVVLEAQGRELCPGPFLPTVAASLLIGRCGSETLRSRLLPQLADGTTVGAFGLAGDVVIGSDLVVNGEVGAVLCAPDADVLVIVVGDDVVVLDSTADGVVVEPLPGLDTTRSIGTVTLNNVAIEEHRVLRDASRLATTVWRILASAEAVGSSGACLEMANDYAKVREQFGRTIGTFQAVKHHLADMLINVEQTAAATWDASRADNLDDAWFAGAVAASHAIRTQLFNAQKNIQLHGGVGYTWEHDAHLCLRRARSLAALIGAGADPLLDVVEAQRTGLAHGASFALPYEAETYRAQARTVVGKLTSLPEDARRDFLVDSGYLVPHWPKPWGRQADVVEQLVLEEEFADIELPEMGITGWVMLTIAQAGTQDQCERWVDDVLRGKTNWCQLFSEPGAGSDAAAVRTSATRVDGGWRVTGQKVWTSLAHECQWGLATVRTDPNAPKHAAVTMMAIDLSSPGVTVKPLREITGDALFNEVFFDDVFVPDADVVGKEGGGWLVARATLGNERVSISGGSGATEISSDDLVVLLDHNPTEVAANWSRRAGEVIAETHTLRLLNARQAARAILGAEAGPEANVTKLLTAENAQHLTELAMELVGTAAVVGRASAVTAAYLYARCLTIAGGTSEIMRNTIAERLLGLPRDPLTK